MWANCGKNLKTYPLADLKHMPGREPEWLWMLRIGNSPTILKSTFVLAVATLSRTPGERRSLASSQRKSWSRVGRLPLTTTW
jgi:hypothetical protein